MGALQRKTIELPSPLGLTPDQQQQVITMAAIVVATQLTTDILEQAKKDFNSLEKDYTALLDRRGKVALLLADVLAERRKAREARDELKARQFDADLGVSFSEQDLAFLDRFPANISLKEFSNDFAAQNLALQFLRAKDPQAYADYRAQADDVTRRTKAYVRTMAGVAAFGALLVTFIDEASDIAGSKNPQLIAQTLPFGLTFVTQALPLVGLAAETTYQGVILEPKKSLFAPKRFNLLDNDQQIALKNASAVFGEWQKRKVDNVFSGALFRNESPGLLWRVSVCDAGEVGRMFDAVVPATQRTDFANRYFGEKQTDTYSFVNALVDDGAPKRRKLADELLLHDHRTSTTDTTHALSDVQKTVTSTFEKWNDAQLLRLIFANHEGPVAYAQMQVGTTLVRPVPSMQAVFEYESFVDSCSGKLDSSQKAAATRDL